MASAREYWILAGEGLGEHCLSYETGERWLKESQGRWYHRVKISKS